MKWAIIDDRLIKDPTEEQIKESEINYIPIYGGPEEIVIQSWWLDEEHTKAIDFAYSLVQLESTKLVCGGEWINPKWKLREEHFKKHGVYCMPQELRSITIPKSQITEEGIISLSGWRNLDSFLM